MEALIMLITANDEILKFAMIETKESLDNLDEIMKTPNLDGIYIGPADLSLLLEKNQVLINQRVIEYMKLL